MTETADNGAAKANLRGRFITFEGGEGAGKSTQIAHLAKRLQTVGISATVTREPGGSPFAERLREVILDRAIAPKSAIAQALLFYAARADHLDTLIRPAMADGKWVLCDRFSDSTRAYQGAAGGIDADAIAAIDALVVGGTQPELTILLDLDPKIGLARANQRRTSTTPGAFVSVDTFESRHLDFHQRLREGFLTIARSDPNRIVVCDAFQNELTLAEQIWQIVATKFHLAAP